MLRGKSWHPGVVLFRTTGYFTRVDDSVMVTYENAGQIKSLRDRLNEVDKKWRTQTPNENGSTTANEKESDAKHG